MEAAIATLQRQGGCPCDTSRKKAGLSQIDPWNKCKEPLAEGIAKLAVAAVICDRKGKVLLLKRRGDGFLGGRYELPGGVVEEDESLSDAIVREVKEEAELAVTAILDPVCHFDFTSRHGTRMRRFGFMVEAEGIAKVNPDLHEDYVWVPKRYLNWLGVTDNARRIIEAYLGR